VLGSRMRFLSLTGGFIFSILIVSPSNIEAQSKSGEACITCHRTISPGIVGQWEKSKHSPAGVTCIDCHQAGKDDPDGFLHNGERKQVAGVDILTVPAYNIVHKRKDGTPYHPKGEGNGYVLTFGDTRVYVAGDTENIPEMKALQNITVAFLPMNLPYTMTPEMVADAARSFRPRILYPYHYGDTDPNILVALLEGEQGIEVRVRNMR